MRSSAGSRRAAGSTRPRRTARAELGQRDPDDDDRAPRDPDPLVRDRAGPHRFHGRRREIGLVDAHARREPATVRPHEDADVPGGLERRESLLDLRGGEQLAREPCVGPPLAHERPLPLVDQVALAHEIRRDPDDARDHEAPDREGDHEPEPESAAPTGRVRGRFHAGGGHGSSLYPSPRTVTMWVGLLGSASTLVRSRRMSASTSRVSPK